MEHKMKALDSSTTTPTVQWSLPVSPQKCCQCIDGEWLRAEKNCQDKTESSCSVCGILISTLSITFCNLSRQLGFRHQHSPLSFQPFLSVGSCCACACGIRFTSFHFQDSTWQLSTFGPPWVGASGFPQAPALLETRPQKSYLSNVLFLHWVWVIAGLSKASATWRQRVNTTSNYNHYYSYCQTIVPISFRHARHTHLKGRPSQAQPAWGYVPWCSLWFLHVGN